MSAAARLIVEVNEVDPKKEPMISAAILSRIKGTGLPTSEPSHLFGADFSLVSGYLNDSGKTSVSLDVRSMSVSWDVLSDEFAQSLVRLVYEIDGEAETSVYVYNLDVEPDFEYYTRSMKELGMLDKEQVNG
jgi:hypothetical protein